MEEGATDLGFEGHWKHAFFTVVSCFSHTYCKTIDPRSKNSIVINHVRYQYTEKRSKSIRRE